MIRCQLYGNRQESLTERHVQSIWYDKSMRPDSLYTRNGAPVRVIHPGSWNLGPGPDFKDAVLEVGTDRRRLKGDVEIHLNPRDWDAHGHGTDPAYGNVICHVTWSCGPCPATLPPNAVSIWIGRFVTSNYAFSPDQIDLSAYPFARLPVEERPCWEELHENPDMAKELLSQAGAHRLNAKARRLAAAMAQQGVGLDQLFYEETMSALGYRWNSKGFRHIARLVPLKQLLSEPESAENALMYAGQFVSWNKIPTRPRNNPFARLGAAARLFACENAATLRNASDFSKKECSEMIKRLTAGHLMGKGRAAAILANVVTPWAIAARHIPAAPDWLPPEDISEPVRLTAFRMFGRDHNPSAWYAGNGIHIQGLIQIHRDFCLQVHPDCGECRLTESLKIRPSA